MLLSQQSFRKSSINFRFRPRRGTLTVDQVREFLRQMNEESEFDDIELDAVALAVVAGGHGGGSGNC